MLEHVPGLPDLMLFWTDDVSVICVSRCGITHGTLTGHHVLTFIWMIMTGDSFKIVSNWVVLTRPASLGTWPFRTETSTALLRLLKHHLPIKKHVASASVPGEGRAERET